MYIRVNQVLLFVIQPTGGARSLHHRKKIGVVSGSLIAIMSVIMAASVCRIIGPQTRPLCHALMCNFRVELADKGPGGRRSQRSIRVRSQRSAGYCATAF